MLKRNIAAGLLISSICTGLFSCSNEPQRNVTLYDNDFVIEHYTEGIDVSDKTTYEQIVFTTKYFDIGPHEPRYRGIIYLSDEEASELMDSYEWEETSPEFEFDEVDISGMDEPWYRCNDFTKDTFKFVNVHYAVFNGDVIIFDIQTM